MKKVSDQCPTLLSHTRWPNGDAFLFLAQAEPKELPLGCATIMSTLHGFQHKKGHDCHYTM